MKKEMVNKRIIEKNLTTSLIGKIILCAHLIECVSFL